MATTTIKIYQGDSKTITEAVSGLSSLAGFTAMIFIEHSDGTALDSFEGTINGLDITYTIKNDDSKDWTPKTYKYETKIWDDDSSGADNVYTLSKGNFKVEAALEPDPQNL